MDEQLVQKQETMDEESGDSYSRFQSQSKF